MLRRWGWMLLAALLLALLGLSQAGRFVSSPVDTPQPADVIIALGGDFGARVDTAHTLYEHGMAPRILLTGTQGGEPVARREYLDWRATFLLRRGVPADVVSYDTRSENSWQEAVNTLRLMKVMGWKRALVVSDPPHIRRLSWVWGKVFRDSGIEYRLIPSNMAGWDADRWWQREKSCQFVLMELIKLVYYRLRY